MNSPRCNNHTYRDEGCRKNDKRSPAIGHRRRCRKKSGRSSKKEAENSRHDADLPGFSLNLSNFVLTSLNCANLRVRFLWKDFRLCKIDILDNYITKMIHFVRSLCMHIKLFFFFFFFFYSIMSCMLSNVLIFLWYQSNFRINVLQIVQVVWGCSIFYFLRFLQADYHLSCLYGLFVLVFLFWSILRHPGSRRCCRYLQILSRKMLPV